MATKQFENQELIIKDFDSNGTLYYCVNDVFLQRWAERSI
jgi:hypothetical protein